MRVSEEKCVWLADTGHVTLHLFDTVEGVMQRLHGAGLAAAALVGRKPLLHLRHCAHHLFVSLTFAPVCILAATHTQLEHNSEEWEQLITLPWPEWHSKQSFSNFKTANGETVSGNVIMQCRVKHKSNQQQYQRYIIIKNKKNAVLELQLTVQWSNM